MGGCGLGVHRGMKTLVPTSRLYAGGIRCRPSEGGAQSTTGLPCGSELRWKWPDILRGFFYTHMLTAVPTTALASALFQPQLSVHSSRIGMQAQSSCIRFSSQDGERSVADIFVSQKVTV